MQACYIPKVYADAFYSVYQSNLRQEVQSLLDALKDASFFSNKRFSDKIKINVLKQLGLSNDLYKVCAIIILNKRSSIFNAVLNAYVDECKKNAGEIDACVKTCVPIGQEDQEKISTIILKACKTSKKVNIINKIDKSVLAGFVARFKSKAIDASAATKLKKLQQATINAISVFSVN